MNLNIIVTGVCGLVRVGPNDLRVLAAADGPSMPSAASVHAKHSRESAYMERAHPVIPRHRAFLQFREQTGLTPMRQVKFITIPGLAPPRHHFVFGNEVLTLKRTLPAENPDLEEVTINPTGIVEMSKVAPGHSKVNPALVASNHDPVSTRVATVMRLESGAVRFHQRNVLDVHKFEPTLGIEPYADAFAREAVIAVNLPGDEWVLQTREFAADTEPVDIMKFAGTDKTFEITFGNAPLEGLLDVDPEPQEEIDHHFTLLYRLINEAPSTFSVPVRVSARTTQVRAGSTNCPPAILG